jgi:hypothetical protein
MSMTGLRIQEELFYGREYSKNFPPSNLIMWAELYRREKQTWMHRVGLKRNKISHCGLMVKEAYEGVEAIARERNVQVERIWEELATYKPKNGFMFNSNIESPYRKLDKYVILADSGSAYSGTMRTIQWISQNGVDSKYIKEDENNFISKIFENDDSFKLSIVSLGFLAFIGKIAYDEYSK